MTLVPLSHLYISNNDSKLGTSQIYQKPYLHTWKIFDIFKKKQTRLYHIYMIIVNKVENKN